MRTQFPSFAFLSEHCHDAHSIDADSPMDAAEGPRKQATTRINVTSEEVAKSIGENRQKSLGSMQEGNQQLDYKQIGRSQSWSTQTYRSSRKGQIEKKQSCNRRRSVHRVACKGCVDSQA